MQTKTIRQSVTLRAGTKEVYQMLMDSKKHSKLIGSKASISRKIAGKFSAFDGAIRGINLDLIPNEWIAQSWQIEMKGWPREHYSRVTFALRPVGDKTRLLMTHSEVPQACYESIKKGWHDNYWTPMKLMLKGDDDSTSQKSRS